MELKFDLKATAKWLALDLEETRLAVKEFTAEAFTNIQICHTLGKNQNYSELVPILEGMAGTASMLHLEQINRYAAKIAIGAKEMKPKVVDNILPLLDKAIEELHSASY